jgi:uncharacterized coiled-coil DUF342 family protein
VTGYKLDNLTVLTENNAISNVVTAGFWESAVIADLLAADPQKLIIFEPDDALYAEAKAIYADESSVEVRNATLADKTGEADYFVFKPNRFSSLLKPKHLLKIYRKNNNYNSIRINVSTVQSVCEQEEIFPSAGNILLLGMNCPSIILSDAVQTDHLSCFDVIIVRKPKQGLYEIEQQEKSLSIVLQENQFNCVQEIAGDAMYTQFVYVRDHQREKVSALQAKVTQAETRNAAIAAQLSETESRSSQFETKAAELNTNYSKLKAQREELTTKVSALEIKGTELATQNTQLDAAVVKAKAQDEKLSADVTQKQTAVEQMAAQISALQNKQNELVDSHKNKDTQIAELTALRDQKAKGHQETSQQAEALKGQNEQLLAQVATLQAKHNEMAAQRDQQAKGHQETKQLAEALKVQNDMLSAARAQQQTEKEQLADQVSALQAKHNELAESQKNKDTQIADLTVQRDQQAKGHQETRQQAESLKAQNEKFNADKAQKLTENEQLAAQVAGLNAKQIQLAETQENKDKQIAELTAQRDQQAKGHQETRQQSESLKAQSEKLSADKAQKLTENQQLIAQVNTLQTKQNELVEGHKNKDAHIVAVTEQRDTAANWNQKNKSCAESLNKQCEELKVYSAERQKSADLALKLQTKAKIDLDNLREKYQAKHNNEQKLVDLVGVLRSKLQQAAEYYYELQLNHPELSETTPNRLVPSQIEGYDLHNVTDTANKIQPTGKKSKRKKRAKSVTRGKL